MYNEEEKLFLKWNHFQENALSAFGTLREDREFADVTLACEDGEQVEVHKVILASSSPFFLHLLRRNKHPHPIIYMRGMKAEDLAAIVNFLYFGEANVYQENLDSFMTLANELQLKMVMESNVEIEPEGISTIPSPKEKTQPEKEAITHFKQENSPHDEIDIVDEVKTRPAFKETEDVTADLQDLDDKIKSMIYGTKSTKVCKVCGKKGTIGHLKDHVESIHITGMSHSCNNCQKTFKSRAALRVHKYKHHRNV